MVFGGRVSVEQGRLLVKALDAMVAEMEEDEREAGDAQTTDVAPQADETGKNGDLHAKAVLETAGNVSAETSAAAFRAKCFR